MSKHIISPSVLAADFSDMRTAVQTIDKSGAGFVHLDVMDGHFVPNMSFGPKLIADVRPYSSLIFDTHLMIDNPSDYIKEFADAGSDYITVHAEACIHLDRVLHQIRDCGCKAGVAIVPSTPVEVISNILEITDLVLVMSVNPGFGGQSLIPYTLKKISALRDMRGDRNYLISVDGGVKETNISEIWNAGCDVAVAGSSFFAAPDKAEFIRKMMY